MTRVEENKNLIKEMYKKTNELPTCCFEENVSFNLGVIALMLMDISKSLAVIADKAER